MPQIACDESKSIVRRVDIVCSVIMAISSQGGRASGALALTCILGAACVRPYVPAPRPFAQLTRPGDAQLVIEGGFAGAGVHGVYAASDRWGIRAAAGWDPAPHDEMVRVEAGALRYGTRLLPAPRLEAGRLFWSFGLDLGCGRAVGAPRTQLNADVEGALGVRWRQGSVGLAVRGTYATLRQRATTDARGRDGRAFYASPVVELRAGPSSLQLLVQGGASYGVWEHGDMGADWPVVVGAGLVFTPQGGDHG